jgi:hypothetical protein
MPPGWSLLAGIKALGMSKMCARERGIAAGNGKKSRGCGRSNGDDRDTK